MAVIDDVNRLAAMDVVYLSRTFGQSTEVFRGRLHQSLSGSWVFNSSTGQNGAVGFVLGLVNSGSWLSSETPSSGITVSITNVLYSQNINILYERIVLTNVIPVE